MVGGGAAMLFALRRLTRSTAPLAAGGSYLLYRGISGRDPIYKALGITRAGVDGSGGIEV